MKKLLFHLVKDTTSKLLVVFFIEEKGEKMKYNLLFIKDINYGEGGKPNGNVALIYLPRANNAQYVVVRNLDLSRDDSYDDLWDAGMYFPDNIIGLQEAIDTFRFKTEDEYISRARLEELATNFKDYIFELEDSRDTNEIIDELVDCYDLSHHENDFFGMQKSDED